MKGLLIYRHCTASYLILTAMHKYSYADCTINCRTFFCICTQMQQQYWHQANHQNYDLCWSNLVTWTFFLQNKLNFFDSLFSWAKWLHQSCKQSAGQKRENTLTLNRKWIIMFWADHTESRNFCVTGCHYKEEFCWNMENWQPCYIFCQCLRWQGKPMASLEYLNIFPFAKKTN